MYDQLYAMLSAWLVGTIKAKHAACCQGALCPGNTNSTSLRAGSFRAPNYCTNIVAAFHTLPYVIIFINDSETITRPHYTPSFDLDVYLTHYIKESGDVSLTLISKLV